MSCLLTMKTIRESTIDSDETGFWDVLINFIVPHPDTPVFLAASAIMGLLSVAVDAIFFGVRGKSLLGVRHGWGTTLKLVVVWPLGATIIGLMGNAFTILQPTIYAAVAVGIGWPAIFAQIVERAGTSEIDSQQPTDE